MRGEAGLSVPEVIRLAVYLLVLGTGIALFTRSLRMRLTALKAARSFDARGEVGPRLLGVLVDVFGQGRLLHGDRRAGIMHALIFWGFVVLIFNTLHFLIAGFAPQADLHLPLLGPDEPLGPAYLWLRDCFTLLVIAAVAFAFYRRLVEKPKRLHTTGEALLILGLIGTLMITDLLMNASSSATQGAVVNPASFIEMKLGPLFVPLGSGNLWVYGVCWWLHLATLLLFLNLLPLSKHFHVLLSPFNVYLRNLEPMGKLPQIDFENTEEFGVSRVTQLSWKNWFDAYNCTECGRCDSFCPANQTSKSLSPQHIITGTREAVYAMTPKLLVALAKTGGRRSLSAEDGAQGRAPSASAELGDAVLAEDFPLLVGDIHTDEALWACTTCGACDVHCPVHIEHVRPIIEMRRHLVLEQEGRFPKELQPMFRGLETQGNPWGLPAHTRMDWAQGLDVPTLESNPQAEYLFYVGCAGSFDSRAKPTTVALVKLLQRAGVNFAVIGKKESCNGDPARRCGNEYLAATLTEQCASEMQGIAPRKVVTACPHCFNALRYDLPAYGAHFDEVLHHSELLSRLVKAGRLKMDGEAARMLGGKRRKIVFHDSCYLGRYNDVYEEPRDVLRSAGLDLVESKSCRDKGFCCGAGGGRMFMEETEGRRVNSFRYEQLEQTGADEVAVACPFCMTMIDDAAKSGERRSVPVRDIALVLEEATAGPE